MSLPTRVSRQQNGQEPHEYMQRELDSMLGRFFGGQPDMSRSYSPYGVDVREDADHLYVEAELPGFKKEDVDITLENQTLTIAAVRSEERREENGNGGSNGGASGGAKKGEWLLNERRHTRFLRSFTLPPTVSEQKVDAKLSDGVLTITLNKREETKPRKIQVG